MSMTLSRRHFTGLLFAAPAIIAIDHLMPVKALASGWITGTRYRLSIGGPWETIRLLNTATAIEWDGDSLRFPPGTGTTQVQARRPNTDTVLIDNFQWTVPR